MNLLLLKIIHLTAAFALFASLGSILLGSASKKTGVILHGLSLLLLLVLGFAMLGKPPTDHFWWLAKIGAWLFLGMAPVLVRRRILPGFFVLLLCLAAGGGATWLVLVKPF